MATDLEMPTVRGRAPLSKESAVCPLVLLRISSRSSRTSRIASSQPFKAPPGLDRSRARGTQAPADETGVRPPGGFRDRWLAARRSLPSSDCSLSWAAGGGSRRRARRQPPDVVAEARPQDALPKPPSKESPTPKPLLEMPPARSRHAPNRSPSAAVRPIPATASRSDDAAIRPASTLPDHRAASPRRRSTPRSKKASAGSAIILARGSREAITRSATSHFRGSRFSNREPSRTMSCFSASPSAFANSPLAILEPTTSRSQSCFSTASAIPPTRR